MFTKLRLRFILVATFCATLIFFTFSSALNLFVYTQTENNIRTILSIISSNNGELPITQQVQDDLAKNNIQESSIYNLQYFSATKVQQVVTINTATSRNITEEQIKDLTEEAIASKTDYGIFEINNRQFAYEVTSTKSKRLVVFLETTNYYHERENILQGSLWIFAGGTFFIALIITFFSSLIIRPYLKNYEKQRMFITNAGHELKTPLAIISANTELQELMTGENEWTESTKYQIERLNKLIARLIRLARLEEQENLQLIEQDISQLILQAAKDHQTLITQDGKQLQLQVDEELKAKVSEEEFYELISIFLDNARKYCDPEGTITLKARRLSRYRWKKVRITISNDYADGDQVDYKRFFDRFYRAETSRNNQAVSGYGIGLSMAQTLVQLFKGQLRVSYKDGRIRFTILL